MRDIKVLSLPKCLLYFLPVLGGGESTNILVSGISNDYIAHLMDDAIFAGQSYPEGLLEGDSFLLWLDVLI